MTGFYAPVLLYQKSLYFDSPLIELGKNWAGSYLSFGVKSRYIFCHGETEITEHKKSTTQNRGAVMSNETKDGSKVDLSRRGLLKVIAAGLLAAPLLPQLLSAYSAETGTGRKKMLIIYYSHTGNTKYIAEKIKEKTGGDLFEIQTVRTYPSQYSALTEEAKRE
ncbi:MAG TPA: hypothetical protein VFG28_02650, partial [Syntrophales bacterium]|nr:hypothetical protein [Syntrophales bacterium]